MAKPQLRLNLGGPQQKSETQKRLLGHTDPPKTPPKRRALKVDVSVDNRQEAPSTTPMPLANPKLAAMVAAAYQDCEAEVAVDGYGVDERIIIELGFMEFTDILLGLGLLHNLHNYNGAPLESRAEVEALYKKLCLERKAQSRHPGDVPGYNKPCDALNQPGNAGKPRGHTMTQEGRARVRRYLPPGLIPEPEEHSPTEDA